MRIRASHACACVSSWGGHSSPQAGSSLEHQRLDVGSPRWMPREHPVLPSAPGSLHVCLVHVDGFSRLQVSCSESTRGKQGDQASSSPAQGDGTSTQKVPHSSPFLLPGTPSGAACDAISANRSQRACWRQVSPSRSLSLQGKTEGELQSPLGAGRPVLKCV